MNDMFEFDTNGNIYIKKNDEYYILNIDKDDNICFDIIRNKILNYDTINRINNIDHMQGKPSKLTKLHYKSMEKAVDEIDVNIDLEDYAEDDVQEIANTYNDIKINPEYIAYENNTYELDECYNDDEDNYFEIFTNVIKNSILLYDPPFFETLIYLGDSLVFRTQLINNQPFYRISIYDNKIQLNIIGTKIKYYVLNTDTLEINKLEEKAIKLI